MKKIFTSIALFLALAPSMLAKNKVTTVEQVTTAVTLTEDVDYVITSQTPITTTGSINLTNTEHAVIIIQNLKPSKALAYLPFIKINGEEAVNDENCMVKMYAQGAIIMPYGKDFKPLTVYSEQNFQGTAVNDFGLEHTGGYMNTLSTAKLNNSIRSFKLKRGYMVTFSNSPGGYGYSRCFIADQEDLEFAELPAVMDKKISSYRVFKWLDTEKKGLANNTDINDQLTLNTGWCYSFGPGADIGMDCECVPHKIEVGWPGNCGSVTYSAHLKTNNEPGNKSDHGVESLESVLNTWEDLMATGKRLCTPSSHDGSLPWMYNFMDSINARGWRCDILDMHCYWPEWNLNTRLEGWYNKYKRPIWVTEFVWGSSWGPEGIFKAVPSEDWDSYSLANQQKNYDVMNKVLTNWNNYPYVERYAYWNSERNCSKILLKIKNEETGITKDSLTLLGKFYAQMNSGIGYNKAYEYIPTVVYSMPTGLTCNYDVEYNRLEVKWTSANRELTDSVQIVYKNVNNTKWEVLSTIYGPENKNMSMRFNMPEDMGTGVFSVKIINYDSDNIKRETGSVTFMSSSLKGEDGFQYNTISYKGTSAFDTQYTTFSPDTIDGVETLSFPHVFAGPTKSSNGGVSMLRLDNVDQNKITFTPVIWSLNSSSTMVFSEYVDMFALKEGVHQYGDIKMLVEPTSGFVSTSKVKTFTFSEPFDEGVTPVVIVQPYSSMNKVPVSIKVSNITNKGFDAIISYQEGETTSKPIMQKVAYIAATPGQARLSDGRIITVGSNKTDLIDGQDFNEVSFVDADGKILNLVHPYMLAGMQTSNYEAHSILRRNAYITEMQDIDGVSTEVTTGVKLKRMKDFSSTTTVADDKAINGDVIGWMIVSNGSLTPTAIQEVNAQDNRLNIEVKNRRIFVAGLDDTQYNIYTTGGSKMKNNTTLPAGIYIVKTARAAQSVVVK